MIQTRPASTSRSKTLQSLRRQLRQLERSRGPSIRERQSTPVSTGIEAVDRLLPESGFPPGSLLEWTSAGPGVGATTLALLAARQAIQPGGTLLVIDDGGKFYPPAADVLGIDLNRTIVVRPETGSDVVWALEQSLRSASVAATLCWVGHFKDSVLRRLQLAAETGGGIGLLLRPISARRSASWAEARFLVNALPSAESASGRRLRVELLRCRGGVSGGATELEIDDETGLVRLAPELADPADSQRAAGA